MVSRDGTGWYGALSFILGHASAASETNDAIDHMAEGLPFSSGVGNPRLLSRPYGEFLDSDYRPPNSTSVFKAWMFIDDAGQGIPESLHHRLDFFWLGQQPDGGEDPARVYLVRILILGTYTPSGTHYEQVADVRNIIATGGVISLPGLRNAAAGSAVGFIEVSCRFLEQPVFTEGRMITTEMSLVATAQPGAWLDIQHTLNAAAWDSAHTETSLVQYVVGTTGNFERVDSVSWSYVPAGFARRFYRLVSRTR